MPTAVDHKHLQRRALTTLTLAATVFCCVSGGPFGLEALVSESGPGLALLLIALIPIVWALPDALTTAELAAALPHEGGYVVWVKRALGPFWGFVNGWWTWMYTLVDVAIYPVLFTTYLGAMLKTYFGWSVLDDSGATIGTYLGVELSQGDLLRWGVSAIIVAVFAFLNIRGTKLVGWTGTGFAIAIIAPFMIMIAVGAFQLLGSPRPMPAEFVPEGKTVSAALASGLGIVMWNYLGWDQLSTVAEEVGDPGRAYPRALLIGVPVVTLLYLGATAIGLPFYSVTGDWVEGAWPAIAESIGGKPLGVLITIAGLISPMALFMASMLASSRVPMVLAEDRFLPKGLADIHPKWGTPWKAILVMAAIDILLTFKTFQELVAVNVVLYGAALTLEIIALVVLRVREPDLPRPFKIPGGWPVLSLVVAFPVVAVGSLVWLSILEEGLDAQWLTMALIGLGPIIYAVVNGVRKREVD